MNDTLLPEGDGTVTADLLPGISNTYEGPMIASSDPYPSLSLSAAPENPDSTISVAPRPRVVIESKEDELAFNKGVAELQAQKEKERAARVAAAQENAVKFFSDDFLAGVGNVTDEKQPELDLLSNDSKVNLLSPDEKKDVIYSPPQSYLDRKDKFLSANSMVDENLNVSFKPLVGFDERMKKRNATVKNNPEIAADELARFASDAADYINFAEDNSPEEQKAKIDQLNAVVGDRYKELAQLGFNKALVKSGVGAIKSFTGAKDKAFFSFKDASTIEVNVLGEDGEVLNDPAHTYEIKIPELTLETLRKFRKEDESGFAKKRYGEVMSLQWFLGVSDSEMAGIRAEVWGSDSRFMIGDIADRKALEKKFGKEKVAEYDKYLSLYKEQATRQGTPLEYAEQYVKDSLRQKFGDIGEAHYARDLWNGAVGGFGKVAISAQKTALEFGGGISFVTSLMPDVNKKVFDALTKEKTQELQDASAGAEILEGSGSDFVNPSFWQKAISGGARVTGDMAPLIVTTLLTRNAGVLAESSLFRAGQIGIPIFATVYGPEYYNRLSQADSLSEQAQAYRDKGETAKADMLDEEAGRIRSTSELNAVLSSAREILTELIFPEERILAGGVKASFSRYLLSVPQNIIEDVASDILTIPQASLLGDKNPNVDLLDTAGTSGFAALFLGAAPVATQSISHLVNDEFDLKGFGKSADQIKEEQQPSYANGENNSTFLNSKAEEQYTPPGQEVQSSKPAITVTDDSGATYTKKGDTFETKSGNVIPIYSDGTGKGAYLLAKLEVENPSWKEQEQQNEPEVSQQPAAETTSAEEPTSVPNAFHTYEDAIDDSIAREFPEYKGGNEGTVKTIKKWLQPLSYIYRPLVNAGYKINLFRDSGRVLGVDHANKEININLTRLGKLLKGTDKTGRLVNKGWTSAALHEEADHIAIRAAGIDVARLAQTAPKELRDAVASVYAGTDMSDEEIGDEMLRMFMQGKITKRDGKWNVNGRTITETNIRGFENESKDAFVSLFDFFAGVDTGKAGEFGSSLQSAYEQAANKFEEVFGESLESHQLSRELARQSFGYRAKRKIYDIAIAAKDYASFAIDFISRLGRDATKEEMEQLESVSSIVDIAKSIDAQQNPVAEQPETKEENKVTVERVPSAIAQLIDFLGSFKWGSETLEYAGRQFVNADETQSLTNIVRRIPLANSNNSVIVVVPDHIDRGSLSVLRRISGAVRNYSILRASDLDASKLIPGDHVISLFDISERVKDAPNGVVTAFPSKLPRQMYSKGAQNAPMGRQQIKTYHFTNDWNALPEKDHTYEKMRELLASYFPPGRFYVFKPNYGANSAGINFSDDLAKKIDAAEEKGLTPDEFLYEIDQESGGNDYSSYPDSGFIVQDYVEFDHDNSYRVHVGMVDGEPQEMGVWKREGGEVTPESKLPPFPLQAKTPLLEKGIEEAKRFLRSFDPALVKNGFFGVDLEFDKNGKPYILELNPSHDESQGSGFGWYIWGIDRVVSAMTGLTPIDVELSQELRRRQSSHASDPSHTYELDSKYADLERRHKAGDEAAAVEAQRMVNEAAKEAMPKSVAIEPILSSKERNADKPLLKLYHGTDANFNIFERGRKGVTDFGFLGVVESERHGIFFAENKDFAETFAKSKGGVRLVTAFLNITNPFTFQDAQEIIESRELGDEFSADYGMARWFFTRANQWEAFDDEDGRKFVDWLESKGYDGAIIQETGVGLPDEPTQEVWVALSPNQIKSADPFTYDSDGKLIPLSHRFNQKNPDIRYASDPTQNQQAPKVILPRRRTVRQRVAYNHTYDRFPAVKKMVGDVYYNHLSEEDKGIFDVIIGKDSVTKADIPMIEEALRGITERSNAAWYINAQGKFPELLAGKDFAFFEKDPKEVRTYIKRSLVSEPAEGETDADKAYQTTGEKRRKKIEDQVNELRSGIYDLIASPDFSDNWNKFNSEQQAQILNGLELIRQIDISKLSNKDLARTHALLENVKEGDFLGFHDLVSKFHAVGITEMLAEIVKQNGDIFNDPNAKISRTIYKRQARTDSIFRYSKAKAFFDAIYLPYFAGIEKYHAQLAKSDNRVKFFFEVNKMSVDDRLEAGIAAILTQFDPTEDEVKEFGDRLAEISQTLDVMTGDQADFSTKEKGAVARTIIRRLLSGVPANITDADAARNTVTNNMGTKARKALNFARQQFGQTKQDAHYVKTVIFGENFRDIENYVHLMPRSVSFSPDERGAITKSLGTQEMALRDRHGLTPGSNSYYELDLGTMLFDGLSDHTYEFSTAYTRLILSHLHSNQNSKTTQAYASLFGKNKSKAKLRHEEVSNILKEIHHSITGAAYIPSGWAGVVLHTWEHGAGFYNALKLINPLNVVAQAGSAIAGFSALIASGRISLTNAGRAAAFISANYRPGKHNIRNVLRGITPNLVRRRENPDAQFDYQKEASPRHFSINTRMHKSNVRAGIAAVERMIRLPISVLADSVSFLVRLINGSPDGAVASLVFISSYLEHYERKHGKGSVDGLQAIENAIANTDWEVTHKANLDTDSVMGNPSNPEMRGALFDAKTTSRRITKNILMVYRQTPVSLSSTGINGLKAAFGSGGELSKADLAVRWAGLTDFMGATVQFVFFDLIKRLLGPAFIVAFMIPLLRRDDKDLTEEEKKAKSDILGIALELSDIKSEIEKREIINVMTGNANPNLKYSRNRIVSLIEHFVPLMNNDAGDFFSKTIFDKLYAQDASKYWLQQGAAIKANIATIEAMTPRSQEEAVEIEKALMSLKALQEFIKKEATGDSKLIRDHDTSYGGNVQSMIEYIAMLSEFNTDEPFNKQIRDYFASQMPVFRDAVIAVKKAEGKFDERDEKLEEKADKTRTKLETVQPIYNGNNR